jgi:hypothetical protein
LSAGHIDGGKDIFGPDLLGIKANGKQVLMGVIGYFQDTPELVDAGAHGVRAPASHKPAPLYQPLHPEINALAVHEESSAWVIHPASAFIPPAWRAE